MISGKHAARATGVYELGMTSNGTEQIGVEFVLEGGQFDGETIVWYGYFSEKAFARTIEALRICGWKGDDLANITGLDANQVMLTVEEDTYNGVTSLKVRWVNKAGGVAMQSAMDGAAKAAFAARVKGALHALGGPKPGPAKAAPRAATPAARPAPAARPTPARTPVPPPSATAMREPGSDDDEYASDDDAINAVNF